MGLGHAFSVSRGVTFDRLGLALDVRWFSTQMPDAGECHKNRSENYNRYIDRLRNHCD